MPLPSLSESDIQIQVADLLRLHERARGFIFTSIPNEGKDRRNIKRLMKLIRMGLRKGAGDLLIVRKGQAYFLEIKKPGGTQSKDQLEFEADAIASGAYYALAYSFDEAVKILQSWSIIP
jgi:hypothetical protein